MCLALPGRITKIHGENADVDFGGVSKVANVSFLTDIKVGDYVLVHVGFAIEKVNKEKTEGMYNLLSEDF